ncbi:unnamed protein product [Ostreobium quekettii]|uniref:Uncharacterized protein n=1 Tax=Ostreobium quekettii TaxID=121088 RepID=A0A8S1IVZ8_9CHLO|nr:unnamed protein product [Ostreobium quekettii]|eukprot:evm.model.scf_627.5 EVM.evm.TU.scf_627.5   scf_627:63522-64200(+)
MERATGHTNWLEYHVSKQDTAMPEATWDADRASRGESAAEVAGADAGYPCDPAPAGVKAIPGAEMSRTVHGAGGLPPFRSRTAHRRRTHCMSIFCEIDL